MIVREAHDQRRALHRAVPLAFDISSRWVTAEMLRVRVIEGANVNHLLVTAGRVRSLRIELAYALAEAEGSSEVMVAGVPFALAEAEGLDDALSAALAVLGTTGLGEAGE